MSFEFLAPDAAVPAADSSPQRRSPIEWVHRGDGAELGELGGWSIVSGYGSAAAEGAASREAAGVCDASFLGKIELQGPAGLVSGTVAGLAGGAALEPGRATLDDGVWWCPLSPERVLAVTPPEKAASLRDRLESAASSAAGFVSVVELTAALSSNWVLGPLAREAFARTTALDMRPEHFRPRSFAPVSVARTPAMVLYPGGDRYLHIFGAGYAAYVWTVFVDAAESLGGRAVGLDAVKEAATTGAPAGA